ncbi:hypothetical protein EMMF5_005428 [Cystobasidiomycetes sp. EMM_F5]
MTAVTEVALARLPRPSSRQQLESNEALLDCVRTVQQQPGCLAVLWDVLSEDAASFIWIVGMGSLCPVFKSEPDILCTLEWETLQHHTVQFAKSPIYPAFTTRFLSFLHHAEPVSSMLHFEFSPRPSECLSEARPVLEVCAVDLSNGHTVHDTVKVCQPIDRHFAESSRPASWAAAIDTGASKQIMRISAWKDIEEHYADKREFAEYKPAIMKAKEHWQTIRLFGHIQPILLPNI